MAMIAWYRNIFVKPDGRCGRSPPRRAVGLSGCNRAVGDRKGGPFNLACLMQPTIVAGALGETLDESDATREGQAADCHGGDGGAPAAGTWRQAQPSRGGGADQRLRRRGGARWPLRRRP